MADHTLVVGQRRVLASGSVVFENNGPISIKGPQLAVSITFEDDPPSPAPQNLVEWKVIDGILAVTLRNWSISLGTGVEGRIGTVDSAPLMMALFVHAVGEKTKVRLLNYTFSVGGPIT